MNFDAVADVTRAVLYEGYLLYPYRPTALKNQQRWMFGRLLPRDYCLAKGETEPWTMQTECLVVGSTDTELEASIRFLQLSDGQNHNGQPTSSETVERDVNVAVNLHGILNNPLRTPFEFQPSLRGTVTLSAVEAAASLFKLSIVVENHTPAGDAHDLNRALSRSLLSTHKLLSVRQGEFISLFDPPASCRDEAASCCNAGAWPVLIGPDAGKRMLSAPIILYDYPQIAPESPGDLFDNTEIDELLSLRIRTLTDVEKREIVASGEQARSVLERAESLTEDQLLQMHGRLQHVPMFQHAVAVQHKKPTVAHDYPFKSGDRVRLCPRARADAFDIFLRGQTATIVSIKRDFEDRIHLGVVLDEDPGADLGVQGRPGHQFFYGPDEVELL
jgi:hypothetical protein